MNSTDGSSLIFALVFFFFFYKACGHWNVFLRWQSLGPNVLGDTIAEMPASCKTSPMCPKLSFYGFQLNNLTEQWLERGGQYSFFQLIGMLDHFSPCMLVREV